MTDRVDDLLSFIDRSPTPYHAVKEARTRLESVGYVALAESDRWSLESGDRRYVVRSGGSLAAFEVGSVTPAEAGFRVVIVTNQSGIGRGYYSEKQFEAFQSHLLRDFEEMGVRIEATYHCPHPPDLGCTCRKPGRPCRLSGGK